MREARLDRPVAFQVLPTSPPNLICMNTPGGD